MRWIFYPLAVLLFFLILGYLDHHWWEVFKIEHECYRVPDGWVCKP